MSSSLENSSLATVTDNSYYLIWFTLPPCPFPGTHTIAASCKQIRVMATSNFILHPTTQKDRKSVTDDLSAYINRDCNDPLPRKQPNNSRALINTTRGKQKIMPSNIEIKARLSDKALALKVSKELSKSEGNDH